MTDLGTISASQNVSKPRQWGGHEPKMGRSIIREAKEEDDDEEEEVTSN
jgi:hypothetical protein